MVEKNIQWAWALWGPFTRHKVHLIKWPVNTIFCYVTVSPVYVSRKHKLFSLSVWTLLTAVVLKDNDWWSATGCAYFANYILHFSSHVRIPESGKKTIYRWTLNASTFVYIHIHLLHKNPGAITDITQALLSIWIVWLLKSKNIESLPKGGRPATGFELGMLRCAKLSEHRH